MFQYLKKGLPLSAEIRSALRRKPCFRGTTQLVNPGPLCPVETSNRLSCNVENTVPPTDDKSRWDDSWQGMIIALLPALFQRVRALCEGKRDDRVLFIAFKY